MNKIKEEEKKEKLYYIRFLISLLVILIIIGVCFGIKSLIFIIALMGIGCVFVLPVYFGMCWIMQKDYVRDLKRIWRE